MKLVLLRLILSMRQFGFVGYGDLVLATWFKSNLAACDMSSRSVRTLCVESHVRTKGDSVAV